MSTITSEIKLRIKTEGDAALTGLGAKLNNLANQATASSQTFKGLAAELRNVQSTTVQSTNNLKAYSASWRELAGSVDIASKEFREATAEAAKLDAQIAKAEGRKGRGGRLAGAAQTVGAIAASGVFGGPEGALGAGIGAIAGGPLGAATGGAIGAQVGMMRQSIADTATYASEIGKLNIALQGVTKTSEEYANAQEAIRSLSDSLNVPIKDATAGFTRLSAAVIGAGGNVNDAEIVFKGITSAIKATGGSAEDVQGALLAMSQVFSKGKVSAEELSGQLGERLPGAVVAFANATGRTLPELQKDLKDGVVGLNDLMKFAITLQETHGASALKMAASTDDAGARMTVALDKLKLLIGETFKPIGAEFQNSIIQMVDASVAAFKIFKEKIDESNKSIANLIGNDNLKGIQSFFKTIVLETLASIDPLTRAYLLLQKISGSIPKGDPNLTPKQLADSGMAGRYPIPVEKPSQFPGPERDKDDEAKKAAKLEKQIKLQTDLNNLRLYFDRQEQGAIALLQKAQLQLGALEKDGNIEARKKIQIAIAQHQFNVDAIKLRREESEELRRNLDTDNARLRNAQQLGIIEKTDAKLFARKEELNTKVQAISQGFTLELKEQTKITAQQLTDSERLFAVLEDQLAIARATTPEQKIRLESQARINEFNRNALELDKQRQDEAVKLQNTKNLELQILLEQINLQERLAALQPKSPLQEFVKQATTELQNLEGVAVSVSQSIGEALGNSISSGIQGLVEGTANAQQIFSDFLKSIGQILIQEGAKMIATYTAIAIAKSLAGLFGGGGANMGGKGYFDPSSGLGVAGPNFGLAKGGVFSSEGMQTFANGGLFSNSIVNSPTLFKFANGGTTRTGLMGEAGPEAIMPLKRGADGKLGVAADMTAAMARYQRQGSGSGAGGSGSDAMGAGEATPVLSMSFETTRFMDRDWVDKDQLQAAMAATERRAAATGAKAGAAKVASQMRNSPGYRRQVGLR